MPPNDMLDRILAKRDTPEGETPATTDLIPEVEETDEVETQEVTHEEDQPTIEAHEQEEPGNEEENNQGDGPESKESEYLKRIEALEKQNADKDSYFMRQINELNKQ